MYSLGQGQKRWLTNLNPVLVLSLVFLLILLKTTGDTTMARSFRSWDPLLAVVIYLGQRRSEKEGLILVVLLSDICSLSSAAPLGVFVIFYVAIFVFARLLSYVFYAETGTAVLVMVAGFALLSRILLTFIAYAFGHGWAFFSWSNLSFSGILANSILGIWVYWALGILDQLTLKVPPENIELADH